MTHKLKVQAKLNQPASQEIPNQSQVDLRHNKSEIETQKSCLTTRKSLLLKTNDPYRKEKKRAS